MLGIVPYSHNNYQSFDQDYNYTDKIQEILLMIIFVNLKDLKGVYIQIFPLKNNIEKYKKFFSEPGELNLKLWERLMEYE